MSVIAGTLDPAGPVAAEIAGLWWWMFWLGAAVYAVVVAALVVALFRRRREGEEAAAPARPERWLLIAGAVIPGIVLAVVLGLTLAAMRALPAAPAAGGLVVEVTGHQWWWEVRYPGTAAVTANEIHIPVGEPVEFRITSGDVIHSFWVPALGGKVDAMPDGTTTLVLTADRPGDYRGACAEFCGLQHAKMALLVVASPRAEFDSWLAAQAEPAAVLDEQAEEGLDVFLAADCEECHTIRGTAAATGDVGPDLTHVASRRTLAALTIPNDRDHLVAWLSDPDEFKEGTSMPAARLDEDELDAVVSYLGALR